MVKIETQNKRKTLNWILNILLIILLVVGAYLFFTKIFGSSQTDFQLIIWLFGFFGIAILKIFNLIYGLNREIGELKISVRESFGKIRKDIEDIKQNLKSQRKRK